MTDRATELRAMAEAANGPERNVVNSPDYMAAGNLHRAAPTIALELATALDLLAKKDEELARLREAAQEHLTALAAYFRNVGSDTVGGELALASLAAEERLKDVLAALTPVPHAGNGEGEPT